MSLISDALKEAQKKRDELSSELSTKKTSEKTSGAKKFLIISLASFIIVIIIFVYLFFIAEKRLQKIEKIDNPVIAKKTFPKKQKAISKTEERPQAENKPTLKPLEKKVIPQKTQKELSVQRKKVKQKKKEILKKTKENLIKTKTVSNEVKVKAIPEKREKTVKTKNYYLKEGEKAIKEGRLEDAVKNYTFALSYSPEDTNIIFNLGIAYLLKKQFLLALNEFEKILKKNPEDKKTLFNAGIALLKIGKVEKAKILWKNLYSLDPNYPEINYFLGIAEDFTQNYDSAKRYYFYYLSKGKNPKLKKWIRERLKQLN